MRKTTFAVVFDVTSPFPALAETLPEGESKLGGSSVAPSGDSKQNSAGSVFGAVTSGGLHFVFPSAF